MLNFFHFFYINITTIKQNNNTQYNIGLDSLYILFKVLEIIGLFLQWLLADFKSLKAKRPNREPEVCDFSKLSKSEVCSSLTHYAIHPKWDAS